MRREQEYELSIGDDMATARRMGSRAFTTARVLGRGTDGDVETVWLDRVIAPHGVTTAEGWRVGGAVSSVLTRSVKRT